LQVKVPERPAWFGHRLGGQRHLGVFDAGSARFFDCGPVDELDLLADGRLREPETLLAGASPLQASPTFDVPVARPSKILCLCKNYAAHAAEFGSAVPSEPIFFTKFTDTLLPHQEAIVLPYWVQSRIDHEVELAVILGFDDPERRGRKYVSRDEAAELVAGYTVLNDVTARQIQGDDRNQKFPWLRSKSFDTPSRCRWASRKARNTPSSSGRSTS
jgi:2-keto-4-pentenoate hydratase/2-oxohepta-3-ene-1,7-dioic acid hydratase in catechol pathway